MRHTVYSFFILSIVFSLFSENIFAQESPQWQLPDGAIARLGKGRIEQIAYSPDGSRLAVGGGIGIWVYDADTGTEVALISGHTAVVNSVAFSPDGNTIASGRSDEDRSFMGCDNGGTSETRSRDTPTGSRVSPLVRIGNTLASGSLDGTVRLWDADNGKPQQHAHGTHRLGQIVLRFSSGWHARSQVGVRTTTVRLWDATTGNPQQHAHGTHRLGQ